MMTTRADQDDYLRIENVAKMFGDFTALEDVSLSIGRGEFICFLGPSGCGKTTLLRVIAGLEQQSQGTLIQDGRDISNLPPSQRDFGIVFQSYALFPNLTVERNIAYGLENVPRSKRLDRKTRQAQVEGLLETVDLLEHRLKYPSQLSGGQQQRVALARALACKPGLLLLDEPLSALDAKVRQHLRAEIHRLQRRLGVTTIMVTHDQEEALAMADRIVVMSHGKVEQIGTPTEIYQEPATPFVAEFIGNINVLQAARAEDGSIALRGDAGLQDKKILACLRPEDIICCVSEPLSADMHQATITGVEFLGAFYRVYLSLPALGDLSLTADISTHVFGPLGAEEGDVLNIRLPQDRLRAFEGEMAVVPAGKTLEGAA